MLHGSTSRSSSPPSPFCHSHDVAYRDLKPENLLLDEEDRLKVTNFGLPALLEQLRHDDMLHTQCGTPGYIAPEVLQKRGYDGARGDMRSRGVMLYVLIAQYLSNPQYYFQVNNQYVWNKLKVVLFPFLHRGHWTRTTELVGGRLSYKPPVQDINAPDMYIPLMAFTTYIVVAGYALGVLGRKLHSQNNFLLLYL
ncbi:protein YIF1B-B-like [Hordeum vulgare]|nr:protein YIF1B-B-like [Hordeum vulgare]